MAGPLTIQRYPTALLPLLGMQSGGQAPGELSTQVSGVLDMLRFYTRDRWENLQVGPINISSAAVVQFTITIPAGQQWLVFSASAQTSGQAAGTTGRYTLCTFLSNNTTNAVYTPVTDRAMALAAGDFGILGRWFDVPLIFRPGDTLGMWCENYTGAPATQFFGQMTIVRLGA